MDFNNVNSFVIPEGEVVSVRCGSLLLWKKQSLPNDYHKLDYIESTGTQYIDTGIKLSDNHSVEIDYQLTQQLQYRTGLFGGLYSPSNTRYGSLFSPSNAALEHGYGLSNTYYQQGVPDINRHVLKQAKSKVYFDGVLIHTFSATNFSVSKTAYLGNFDYSNYKPALARYYSSKWWDGDTLVRDFVPCYRKSDGTAGMYDTVTDTFFTNAGTGEFVFEKPKYKAEVTYLESTGTQWIDTGVTIDTATDEVELDFQNIGTTKYKWLMGEHDNNARFGLGSGDGTDKRNVTYGSNTYKVKDEQIYDSMHRFVANKSGVFLDGMKIVGFASFASTSTLYLFNLNLNSASYMGSAKIWRYSHARNGVLIRDMIPSLDWNNVACMYDKVSGELFYNKGTGDFLYG